MIQPIDCINLYQRNKQPLLLTIAATFIIGLIAHGYSFFNPILCGDSATAISSMAGGSEWAIKIMAGRIAHIPNFFFRGHIAAPWLLGFLSLLWLSFANFFLLKAFSQTHNKWIIVSFCGLTATSAAITITNASFIHETDTYMLAFLMASLGIYFFSQYKKGLILFPIFIFVSLCLYQAYFALIITSLIMLAIIDTIQGKNYATLVIKYVKSGFAIGIALIVYYFATALVHDLSDIMPSYGYNSYAMVKTINGTLYYNTFIQAHADFWTYITCQPTYYTHLATCTYIFAFFASLVLGLKSIPKSEAKWHRISLTIILFAMLPYGIYTIYFLTRGIYHNIMCMPFCLVYFLWNILIFQNKRNRNEESLNHLSWSQLFSKAAGLIVIGVICLSNIIYANHAYLRKHLAVESDLVLASRIINRIETYPDYVPRETPVTFIGTLDESIINEARPGFAHIQGFGMGKNTAYSYLFLFKSMFENILGYPIEITPLGEAQALENSPEIQAMPTYPRVGCTKMVEGKLILKLSDTPTL